MNYFYSLKTKSILIIMLLFFLSIAFTNAQTTYYSWSSGGGNTDVTDLDAWRDDPAGDGSGDAPLSFEANDQYVIANADVMDASELWQTSTGTAINLTIEDGGIFSATGLDHKIFLSLEGSAKYQVSSTYNNLSFNVIESTSIFEIVAGSAFRTNLNYPNLEINSPGGTITLNNATILGDLTIYTGTVRGATSTSPTSNIGGNLNLYGGTLLGVATTGNPTFNIAGSFLQTGGTFRGTQTAGSPIFIIGADFSYTSGTYTATQGTSTGRPTFRMAGNGTITSTTMSDTRHNFEITGTTSFANNFTLLNLTIAGTGTLTPPPTLNITGNFTNNGTFNHNNGTVVFTGTSGTIAGTTATNFYNLTISGTKSLGSNQNLIGTLSLSSASSSFSTTGYTFTLISDASGTARIASVPSGATFNGNITMQRYIPASGRYWYHLSSPVTNATVSQWQTGAPTTGFYITGTFTGASNPGNGITSYSPSMNYYNASTGAWANYPTSSNTELLTPNIGYRAFLRDGGASQAPTTSAKTISVTGTPNTGNQSFPLSYAPTGGNPAGGWNLLGNPYPSDITGDLTNSAWIKSGLAQTSTYIWDADAQTYVSCNGGTGACSIPSSQAFWIQVGQGGGNLSATENVKIGGSTTIYKTSVSENQLTIKLTNVASSISNSSYLRILENTTRKFDADFDAYKLDNVPNFGIANNAISIATKSDTLFYSINSIPSIEDKDTIPLYIVTRIGENNLDFSSVTLPSNIEMYLLDQYNSSISDITSNPIYTFDVTSDTLTQRGRFKLVFTKTGNTTDIVPVVKEASSLTIYPNPIGENTTRISIENLKGSVAEITIVDVTGKPVYGKSLSLHNGNLNEILTLEGLKEGIYTLTCKSESGLYTKKLVIK